MSPQQLQIAIRPQGWRRCERCARWRTGSKTSRSPTPDNKDGAGKRLPTYSRSAARRYTRNIFAASKSRPLHQRARQHASPIHP